MPRAKSDHARLYIRLSPELQGYLEELAEHGIQGQTAPEVARSMISREVERLIQDEFLVRLRRQRRKS